MANLCSFEMIAIGTKENMKKFIDALSQEGPIWMGRGAAVYVNDDNNALYTGDNIIVNISGSCKWGLIASLIQDAISMQHQKETSKGIWDNDDGFLDTHEFITLFEACKKWNIQMEAYSEEPGQGFAEHLSYINDVPKTEVTKYYETWIDHFDTKESAEKEHGPISDEAWDNGYISNGGFAIKYTLLKKANLL